MCEGEQCYLEQKEGQRLVFTEIYHRVDHPMNDFLHPFVAGCNTRASAALGELALVIPRCRTDQFSLSFLPSVVRRMCLVEAP